MTLSRSSSRIAIVITPVLCIAASQGLVTLVYGRKCGHLNLARTGHYNLALTWNVQAVFKCLIASQVQMSQFLSPGVSRKCSRAAESAARAGELLNNTVACKTGILASRFLQ